MLDQATINQAVSAALTEDAPTGDASAVLIPESVTASAELRAREPGVFSGGAVFAAAFQLIDPSTTVDVVVTDGARFEPGDLLATVAGSARTVLRGERIGLNFVQRMSGIATLTRRYVDAIAGTKARIFDTRKTTPLLRAFERQAVLDGGGTNHRFSLSDAVMVKDNHLAILQASGVDLVTALRRAIAETGNPAKFEVEVDRIDQIPPLLEAGVPIIMLDNFTPAELREGVDLIAGRALVEASGGVNLDSVRAIAESGVDIISVGALTHSARGLDLGLDIDVTVA